MNKQLLAIAITAAVVVLVTVAAAPRPVAKPSDLDLANAASAIAQANAAACSLWKAAAEEADAESAKLPRESIAWASMRQSVVRNANLWMDAQLAVEKYSKEAAEHYERAKSGN